MFNVFILDHSLEGMKRSHWLCFKAAFPLVKLMCVYVRIYKLLEIFKVNFKMNKCSKVSSLCVSLKEERPVPSTFSRGRSVLDF